MKKIRILLTALAVISAMTSVNAFADEAVQSKFGVKIYGKIKLDASYDDSRVSLTPGNYARWVDSETGTDQLKDDPQFNMTAMETRLGLKFTGPTAEGMKTGGLLEVDFYDPTLGENKPQPYMRHAYVEITLPDTEVSLLAGQTADVIFPLEPTILNNSIARQQGNIGYRRPQIRVSQGMEIDEDTKLFVQAALTRTIGSTGNGTATTSYDSGSNAGFPPTLQLRGAVSLLLLTEKPATIGLNFHTGKEKLDNATPLPVGSTTKSLTTSSYGIDLVLPVTDLVTVKGEYWSGKNLSAYYGGIGQGVNIPAGESENKAISASGGWLALGMGPVEKWTFNVGAGMDVPKAADLAYSARKKNQIIYGNAIYALNDAVQLGLEVSSLETTYKEASATASSTKGDDLRIQGSMIYNF